MARQRFPVLQPEPVMCCTIGLTNGSRRLPAVMKPSFFLSEASSFVSSVSALASTDAASPALASAVVAEAFLASAAGVAGLALALVLALAATVLTFAPVLG